MQRLAIGLALLLCTAAEANADTIINGNFESGYTGFTTDYVLPPTNIVGGQGQYMLVTNPANHHPSGAFYFDHTKNDGTGLMAMFNEYTTANKLVWGETVGVVKNSDYLFTVYISSWVGTAPSLLDLTFNGVSLGTIQAPSNTGEWVQFSFNWNSGSATMADIQLRNLTTADVGGDFALDDLSLEGPAVPAPPGITLALTGIVTFAFRAGVKRIRNWI